jgi:uncharacterized membrane protein YhaH (DUF805 family)
MGFVEAVTSAFKNYVNFHDRSCRSAYWWYVLFIFLVNLVLAGIDSAMGMGAGGGILSTIFGLATLLPSIAVGVRRLHDIDRSGWWLLIGFIPLIGIIVLIVWACMRGTPGDNRFGPNPLAGMGGASEVP